MLEVGFVEGARCQQADARVVALSKGGNIFAEGVEERRVAGHPVAAVEIAQRL